jgi:DNA-binding IclR family transcriptional regulator
MLHARAALSSKTRPGSEPDTAEGVQSVKSIRKAFAVLEAFRDRPRQLSLGEIAMATGLDKSAVQRFTRTLRELGYLQQDPATRRYALGCRVLDLSFAFLQGHPLVERASPVLVDLRRTVRERVDLSLFDGDTLVYALRMQAKRESFAAALVGRRQPLFCSAGGRAVLARLDEAAARRLVEAAPRQAYTPATLTDPDAIMAKVAEARQRGYALQAGEWRPSEIVIAAALVGADGVPQGAVHVAGSARDWTPDRFEAEMAPQLAAAIADIRLV